MRFLRTNTACRVTVGPFFDKTDGVTPETGLTVTSCKLTLMVDTGNVPTLVIDASATASGGNNDMVHVTGDDAGFYDLELTAAQTNYLGRAILAITDAATHCPVFHEFMIIPAMMYDSVILGTDRLDTNVTHIGDQSQTARDIGASVLLSSGTGTGQVSLSSGLVTLAGVTHTNAVIPTVTNTGTLAGAATVVLTDASLTSAKFAAGATIPRCTLVDTTTTNTDMRGTDNAALAATALSTAQWTNTLATNLGTTNSTVATNLDATISSRLASASYAAAPSAATNASAVRTELTSELLVMTRLGTAIALDGSVYQFTTNALENAPGGSTSVSIMPVSGSATTGNVLDGGRIKGQYGAPLTGLTVTCTTTNAGVTSARDLTAYEGELALVVFENDDEMDYGTRIVNGADITVSSNVATISSTASHVLNTLLGENLRWCLREDKAAPSIVFAIGDYTCQRAPVTVE